MATTEKKKRRVGRPSKYDPTPKVSYTCFYCGKSRSATQFYGSPNPLLTIKLAPICKECARRIANRIDEQGNEHGLTVDSLKKTLKIMDRPFVEKIYTTSQMETENRASAHRIGNVFGAYMKNISSLYYQNMTWEDSDMFKSTIPYGETQEETKERKRQEREKEQKEKEQDIIAEIETNKKDTIRLLGYDPFDKEAPEDKPLLYAKLIGYLDASPEANEDEMKVSSIIEIVKLFSQTEKINSVIARLMSDHETLADNIATIKTLESTKKDNMTTALNLAKDNGISFLHNNNNSKGTNTLSGKLKKLNELNLREQEVNKFDVGTCEGMQQVADISNSSILKQIHLNENDFPEMLREQRTLINKWKKIAEKAQEQARLLLRENVDLKATLNEKGKEFVGENSEPIDTDEGVNSEELDDAFHAEMASVSDDILSVDDTVKYDADVEITEFDEDEEVGDDDE